jgi:hypothetical protein
LSHLQNSQWAERRTKERLVVNLKITLIHGDDPPETAEMVDLSEGGCLFRSALHLPVCAPVAFEFVVAPGTVPCQAAGNIIRREPSTGRFAVQFTGVTNPLREFVSMALSMKPADRAEIFRHLDQPVVHLNGQ